MKLGGLMVAIVAMGVFACTSNVPDEGPTSEDTAEAEEALVTQRCGAKTCAAGLVCCNASCGTCVKPGSSCTQHACGPVR